MGIWKKTKEGLKRDFKSIGKGAKGLGRDVKSVGKGLKKEYKYTKSLYSPKKTKKKEGKKRKITTIRYVYSDRPNGKKFTKIKRIKRKKKKRNNGSYYGNGINFELSKLDIGI